MTADAITNPQHRVSDHQKIWVIVRVQGEYSDRSEDCVCWFPTEDEAKAFTVAATHQSRDAAARWDSFNTAHDYNTSEKDVEEFKKGLIDPTFDPSDYDSRDVSYYACETARGLSTDSADK